MPKTAYLIGETNASTGSITETSLVLGVMTPLAENASTFTACVDACAIVALPWRIFGRGKEGKTVSALAGQSKSYDLTKGDPTIKIYHREMFAKLKVRPIDTEVVFDRIMGVPMRFLFYTFLRRSALCSPSRSSTPGPTSRTSSPSWRSWRSRRATRATSRTMRSPCCTWRAPPSPSR